MGIQQGFIERKIRKAQDESKKTIANRHLVEINKIAIFVDEESKFDDKEFKTLQKLFKLRNSHFHILTYKEKKSNYNEFRGAVLVKGTINWRGVITSKSVNRFLEESYDLLIDYTQADNAIKELVVSLIKAKLKVGYAETKDELYDIMISVISSEIELFNKEMINYLKIMKLI